MGGYTISVHTLSGGHYQVFALTAELAREKMRAMACEGFAFETDSATIEWVTPHGIHSIVARRCAEVGDDAIRRV